MLRCLLTCITLSVGQGPSSADTTTPEPSPPPRTPAPDRWLLMQSLQGTWPGEALEASRTRVYGWANASGNVSTSKNSNTVDSYWVAPNSFQLDQGLFRIERQVDSVQTDHIDWGFRSTHLYGIDYHDPEYYHLIVDTARLNPDEVADAILRAAG